MPPRSLEFFAWTGGKFEGWQGTQTICLNSETKGGSLVDFGWDPCGDLKYGYESASGGVNDMAGGFQPLSTMALANAYAKW